MFKHLISKITYPEKLEAISPQQVKQWRRHFPSVTEDYFTFLQEMGWGSIGGMMMYYGLENARDLIKGVDFSSENIVVFGDNWQGSLYGFDLKNGAQLVEITPERDVELVVCDFRQLIHNYAN